MEYEKGMQTHIECESSDSPLDTVVFECSIFFDKAEACLFQHVLTSGVLHHGICVHSSHSQLAKGDFYCQTLCLRSISFSLYRVVLHMDTQCAFFFIMVYLLQLQFSDYSISKHDCKQPARSILPLCIKISIYGYFVINIGLK